MSILGKLFGGAAAEPIEALGNVFDKVFTSDEDRLKAQAVLDEIAQKPHILQAEINKIEAAHRSVFIAGWRPAIGWVCSIGLAFPFLINPILQWYTGAPGPEMPLDALSNLVIALLGLGAYRTAEKVAGKSK